MSHVVETASSGRAKCRGCNQLIAKGELRFGERHPNVFGDGEMTLWFHLDCAAYKRPEPLLEVLDGMSHERIPGLDRLEATARFGVAHRRLPRLDGAQHAPTGRARCRSCRELIERGSWRIPLVYFEESRFEPSGYVHATCAADYFETTDLIDRIRHFSPELGATELEDLRRALGPSSGTDLLE